MKSQIVDNPKHEFGIVYRNKGVQFRSASVFKANI